MIGKQNSHLREKPGVCMVREYARSPVTEIQITRHDTALSPDLPHVIVPTGLLHARRQSTGKVNCN